MEIRLLQIANTLGAWAGGPTQNAYELHDALNARKDVLSHLISARGDSDPARITVAAPEGFRRTRGERATRLLRLLLTSDVVLVHGYYVWWIPVVAPLARALGKGVVVVPHGSLTRHQRKSAKAKKLVWEIAAGPLTRGAATAFAVQSEAERRELLEAFPRVRVIVGGIGTPLAEPRADRPAPGDGVASPVRLLSLSRIAPKKRIDLMIDAVAELARRGVDSRLVVAGDGDDELERRLRDRVVSAGVADRVEFTGPLAGEAKERAFADAQYFLAPSDDENFGISVAEALARAVPLITSTAVASADGLPDDAGAVIAAPTGATVADAVQRLLQQDQMALRANARAFALAHFDWDVVADRWAGLLEQVRGARRTRASRLWSRQA